jgi:hypothetical protein
LTTTSVVQIDKLHRTLAGLEQKKKSAQSNHPHTPTLARSIRQVCVKNDRFGISSKTELNRMVFFNFSRPRFFDKFELRKKSFDPVSNKVLVFSEKMKIKKTVFRADSESVIFNTNLTNAACK